MANVLTVPLINIIGRDGIYVLANVLAMTL
jgi:hypothetical protein